MQDLRCMYTPELRNAFIATFTHIRDGFRNGTSAPEPTKARRKDEYTAAAAATAEAAAGAGRAGGGGAEEPGGAGMGSGFTAKGDVSNRGVRRSESADLRSGPAVVPLGEYKGGGICGSADLRICVSADLHSGPAVVPLGEYKGGGSLWALVEAETMSGRG